MKSYNLSRTYEKLTCKGEPYRFSAYQDPLVQTDRDRVTLYTDLDLSFFYIYSSLFLTHTIDREFPFRITTLHWISFDFYDSTIQIELASLSELQINKNYNSHRSEALKR